MKFFEKNIKDRFKNASSLKGVDADDLWNNIESVIAEAPSNRNSFFFRKKNLFLLLSFFIIGSGIVWYQFSEFSPIEMESTNTASRNQIQKVNEKKIDIKKVGSPSNDASLKKTDIKNPTTSKNKISENEPPLDLSNIAQTNQSVKQISKSESIAKSEIFNKNKTNETEGNEILNHKINEVNLVENTSEINKNQEKQNITPQAFLEKEKLANRQLIHFSKIEPLATLLQSKEENQLELKGLFENLNFPKEESRFSLGLFAGVHTVKNKFSSSVATDQKRVDDLNNNFKSEIGQSYTVEVNYRLGKNIFITSGFEYLKTQSEFNLVLTWDSITSPNASLFRAERTIKHHNKLNYFSIPLLVGFQKTMGKFEFGTNLGVGLNFVKSQTGKSLNYNEQVAVYPNTENDLLPVSNFFTSYHLRPYLNYKLKEKIGLQFRTDLRYQHFGNSDFYKLNTSSFFGGISGGVLFRF